MAKIIKIEDNIVSVGNDNGELIEIRIEDCNFDPNVGDEVSIFSSDTKVICAKNESSKNNETDAQSFAKNNGININLVQNQNSNNGYDDNYYSTNSKKVVNKVSYIILAILFGGIGIHKFYSGKTVKGIFYLLFSWTGIPSIIGIIEGICACFKKEDSNGRILI